MLYAETIAKKISLPIYTATQIEIMDTAVATAKANSLRINSWTSCRQSEGYIERDSKIWAIYSGARVIFELPEASIIGDDDAAFEYLPAFINGHIFRVDSLEGENGMLVLFRCVKQNGESCVKPWSATLIQTDCVELR